MENQMTISDLTLTQGSRSYHAQTAFGTLKHQVRHMVGPEHEQETMYGESDEGVIFDLDPSGQGHTTFKQPQDLNSVFRMKCIAFTYKGM